MQVYKLMQCMYVGKHMCVNACDCTLAEDRKTVSILFCLPSSCPFEAESDEWSTSFSNLTASDFPQYWGHRRMCSYPAFYKGEWSSN